APSGTLPNKFMATIRPNASGKSDLQKVLALTARFVVRSFKKDDEDTTGFLPHLIQPDQQSRVTRQSDVADAGTSTKGRPAMNPTVYRYEVAATTTHVIHEKLSAKTSRTFTRIYERILDGEEYQFKGIAKRYSVNMPKNASMIAWLAR